MTPGPALRVFSKPAAALTPAEGRAACRVRCAVWPPSGEQTDLEARAASLVAAARDEGLPPGRERQVHLATLDGEVVGAADSFGRLLGTEAGELPILALAAVATLPAARGRGAGAAVVRAALARVAPEGLRWGLWQCAPAVQGFYAKLGAVPVGNRFVDTTAEAPAARPWWDPLVMRWPAGEGWPGGTIDLRGPAY